MKHTIPLSLLISLFSLSVSGQQNYETIEQSILANNTTIKALHDKMQARQTRNHIGLTLEDPQVEYNHFFAPTTPDGLHYRNDFNITQQFDFATLFGLKRKMARSQDELAQVEYEVERLQVILTIRQTVVSVIAYNRCLARHKEEEQLLFQAVKKARKAYEEGKVNLLHFNKMQLLLTNLLSTIAEEETERTVCLQRLTVLAGDSTLGTNIAGSLASDTLYPDFTAVQLSRLEIFKEFAQKQDIDGQLQQRFARSESIPRLTLGYVSELSTEEKFRGFTVGMNIPLWSNKNKVKSAQQQWVAQGLEIENQVQQIIQQKQELQARSASLKVQNIQMQTALQQYSSADVLYKAYIRGDVSATEFYSEFINEMEFHHRVSQLERYYQQTLVELSVF